MARLPTELNAKEKKAALDLAAKLQSAFPWSKTPNGDQYWREVKRNLESLAWYRSYAYDPVTNSPGFVVDDATDELEMIEDELEGGQ